jgi:hypothetical protein
MFRPVRDLMMILPQDDPKSRPAKPPVPSKKPNLQELLHE